MKRIGITAALSLSLLSGDVLAARPGYTYVGGGYTNEHLEDFNHCTQDGIWLESSLSLDGQIFYQLDHSDVKGARCGSTRTTVSAGLRNDYGRSSNAYAKASLILQRENGDLDPGLALTGGVRSFIRRGLELNAAVAVEQLDDYNQKYIAGGVRYGLFKGFNVGVEATLNTKGSTGLRLGGRYNF